MSTSFFMLPFTVQNVMLPSLDVSKIDLLVDSEPHAYAHWLLQNDNNRLIDSIRGEVLTAVNNPAVTEKGVIVQGSATTSEVKNFKTGLNENPSSSMIVVFKTPSAADWQGNNLPLCGSFAGVDGGKLCYTGLSIMRSFIPADNSIAFNLPAALDYDTWYIMGWSTDTQADNSGTEKMLAGGIGSYESAFANRTFSDKKVELGMSYNFSASYSLAEIEIAEFIYFDKSLSFDELKSVFARSKIRMAKKGISIKV